MTTALQGVEGMRVCTRALGVMAMSRAEGLRKTLRALAASGTLTMEGRRRRRGVAPSLLDVCLSPGSSQPLS